MRVPTLYGDNRTLAQKALAETARLSDEAGNHEESMRLLRQTVELGADTEEGRSAKAKLAALVR